MKPLLDRQAPKAALPLQPAWPPPAVAGALFCPPCSPESPTRLLGGSARSRFRTGIGLACLLLIC